MLIIKEETPTEELEKQITKGLCEHAIEAVGHDGNIQRYAFIARENDLVIGAIIFQTFWGALHIKNLHLQAKQRGKGIGKALVKHTLQKGRELNCSFTYLETMNFQAVDFYKSLGFEEEFVRTGYERGCSFHYLSKKLDFLPLKD